MSEDKVLGRPLAAFGHGNQTVGHLRLYTRKGMEEMLELHGYRILDFVAPASTPTASSRSSIT